MKHSRFLGVRRKTIICQTSISNMSGEAGTRRAQYFPETVMAAVLAPADIVPVLNETYMEGVGMQMHQYYKYGLTKYVNPPPRGKSFTIGVTQDLINSMIPPDSLVIESDVGLMSMEMLVSPFLSENYGYNPEDHSYKVMPNDLPEHWESDVTVTDDGTGIEVLFFDPDTFPEEGVQEDLEFVYTKVPTPVVVTPDMNDYSQSFIQLLYRDYLGMDIVEYTIESETSPDDVEEEYDEHLEVTNDDFTFTVSDTHVTVTIEDGITTKTVKGLAFNYSTVKFEWYMIGSGNQAIDNLCPEEEVSDLFPTVCFRREKEDLFHASKKNTDYYKKSKKILKKAGMNIESLHESIYENDMGDIRYLYFVPGVPCNSREKMSKRYMYEFIEELVSDMTKGDVTSVNDKWFNIPRLTYTHNGLTLTYTFSPMKRTEHEGTVAGINRTTIDTVDGMIQVTKQISLNKYVTYTFGDIWMYMPVKGGKGTTGKFSEYTNGKEVKFFFVLTHRTKQRLGLWNFTQLTTDCFMMISQVYEVKKMKWWEFVLAITIATINFVVQCINTGNDYLNKWMDIISPPSGTLMRLLQKHANDLLDKLLVFGLEFAERILGAKLAMIALIVAAIAIGYFFPGIVVDIFSYLAGRGTAAQTAYKQDKYNRELMGIAESTNAELEIIKEKQEAMDRKMDFMLQLRKSWAQYAPMSTYDEFVATTGNIMGGLYNTIDMVHSGYANVIPLTLGIMPAHLPDVDEYLNDDGE